MKVQTLFTTADAMVQSTIRDCLELGERSEPVGKDPTYELLRYQTGISEPRCRVTTFDARPLNPVVAVARWVWLMAGNDRVADIAYYEPKVAGFSDNGTTVPGSCYGARLFNSQPNINQIDGVIRRLTDDHNSRQASAVVWQPHDAVRDSHDIPCTHGMFFHVRDGKLEMTVTMRSNNAFRILPFNIFEFTMLQEYVAASLGLEAGDYYHWAASMHVYDNEREMPATNEIAYANCPYPEYMPMMPYKHVRQQVRELCILEARLRHLGHYDQMLEVSRDARNSLNIYFFELFAILQAWTAGVHHFSGWGIDDCPEWARAGTTYAIENALQKGII